LGRAGLSPSHLCGPCRGLDGSEFEAQPRSNLRAVLVRSILFRAELCFGLLFLDRVRAGPRNPIQITSTTHEQLDGSKARVLPNREMVPTVPSPHRPQPQASSTVARIRRPRAGGTAATSTTRSGLREASTSPDHHTRGAGPMRMRCGGDEYDRTGGGRGRQRQPADRPTDPGTWTW
jgi:hypothetical protein